ncbi:hypothetical protein NUM_44420 [Actinocatenispora comari]|uniref:Uncharacterized protein n=1 Tax=Actinocatenispora comari TaxID=2807577 RepID=A0A8J4ADR9_9ACTN|nr:hypothetical protein NUM_44420 [Actinocatenispora comari]
MRAPASAPRVSIRRVVSTPWRVAALSAAAVTIGAHRVQRRQDASTQQLQLGVDRAEKWLEQLSNPDPAAPKGIPAPRQQTPQQSPSSPTLS